MEGKGKRLAGRKAKSAAQVLTKDGMHRMVISLSLAAFVLL